MGLWVWAHVCIAGWSHEAQCGATTVLACCAPSCKPWLPEGPCMGRVSSATHQRCPPDYTRLCNPAPAHVCRHTGAQGCVKAGPDHQAPAGVRGQQQHMGQGEQQQQQQPGASAPAACRHTACIIVITSCLGLRRLCCGCVAAVVLPLSPLCPSLCCRALTNMRLCTDLPADPTTAAAAVPGRAAALPVLRVLPDHDRQVVGAAVPQARVLSPHR